MEMNLRTFLIFVIVNFIEFSDARDTVTVMGGLGGRIVLPCIPPGSLYRNDHIGQKLSYVEWHRGRNHILLCRYTADEKMECFESRSKLTFSGKYSDEGDLPSLEIEPLLRDDHLMSYSCTAHYQHKTLTSYTILTVATPAGYPVIQWQDRIVPVGSAVGPILEGTLIKLTCRAEGGWPTPKVTWWTAGQQLESENGMEGLGTADSSGVAWADLKIIATRKFLSVPLVCHAYTDNKVLPRTTAVTLDITLIPLSVKIHSEMDSVKEGHVLRLECISIGSNPACDHVWWHRGRRLAHVATEISPGGNFSKSSVSILVMKSDNGQNISCEAVNPRIITGGFRTNYTFNVGYQPILNLSLGEHFNPNDLRKVEDIFMKCLSDTNPKINHIKWLFQGEAMDTKKLNGIIISGNHLALQNIDKKHSGKYECSASNKYGTSYSNSVELNIKYPPVCAQDTTESQNYRIIKHKGVLVVFCSLDSNPKSDLEFIWSKISTREGSKSKLYNTTFNESYHPDNKMMRNLREKDLDTDKTTGELSSSPARNNVHIHQDTQVPGRQNNFYESISIQENENLFKSLIDTSSKSGITILNTGTTSKLTMPLKIAKNIKKIECSGQNNIGRQLAPCIVELSTFRPPPSLINCTFQNVDQVSSRPINEIYVSCAKGTHEFDDQIFKLEAFQNEQLIANLSSKVPIWKVENVDFSEEIHVNIWSKNKVGRSPSVSLNLNLFQQLNDSPNIPVKSAFRPFNIVDSAELNGLEDDFIMVTIISVLIGSIIVVIVLILLVLRYYYYQNNPQDDETHNFYSSNIELGYPWHDGSNYDFCNMKSENGPRNSSFTSFPSYVTDPHGKSSGYASNFSSVPNCLNKPLLVCQENYIEPSSKRKRNRHRSGCPNRNSSDTPDNIHCHWTTVGCMKSCDCSCRFMGSVEQCECSLDRNLSEYSESCNGFSPIPESTFYHTRAVSDRQIHPNRDIEKPLSEVRTFSHHLDSDCISSSSATDYMEPKEIKRVLYDNIIHKYDKSTKNRYYTPLPKHANPDQPFAYKNHGKLSFLCDPRGPYLQTSLNETLMKSRLAKSADALTDDIDDKDKWKMQCEDARRWKSKSGDIFNPPITKKHANSIYRESAL